MLLWKSTNYHSLVMLGMLKSKCKNCGWYPINDCEIKIPLRLNNKRWWRNKNIIKDKRGKCQMCWLRVIVKINGLVENCKTIICKSLIQWRILLNLV